MPPDTLIDERPLPALWTYVQKVYSTMKEEAETGIINPGAEREETGLIYEGHLTNLFSNLGIPNPYYTSVTRMLKLMGCCVQLRRGGGPSASRWCLDKTPTEDDFRAALVSGRKGLQNRGKLAQVEQRIRDLTSYTQRLESRIAVLEAHIKGVQ